jgi:hypothetical protein
MERELQRVPACMRRISFFLISTAALSVPTYAEWVLALYTGTSHSARSDLRVRQSATGSDAIFRDVNWEPRPFDDAPYYGISLAWYPRDDPQWNASFDFTHYKMYLQTDDSAEVQGQWNGSPVDTRAPVDARISSFEISHGVNLSALNVGWRGSAAAQHGFLSRVTPEAGAGLVGYLPHAEGSINGVSSEADYHLSGSGYQAFAGAEYRVSPRIGVLVRVKFDVGRLDMTLSPQTRIETRSETLHGLAGVALHWGHQP